jgi:hypothetical protein
VTQLSRHACRTTETDEPRTAAHASTQQHVRSGLPEGALSTVSGNEDRAEYPFASGGSRLVRHAGGEGHGEFVA